MHTTYSNDGRTEPKELVLIAKRVGLSAVAVTDHNRPAGAREVARIAQGHDLLVVPASEVSSFNGHILALGVSEPIHRDLSADETIRLILDNGGLPVAAHPGRFYTGLDLIEVRAARFQAVEVANGGSSIRQNQLAVKMATGLNAGMTGGSDAHWPQHIGRCRTVFDNPPSSVEELLEEIRAQRTRGVGDGLTLGQQWSHNFGMFGRWLRRGGHRM
jgi:predicted metal-dependent phosphoesterase TrpH